MALLEHSTVFILSSSATPVEIPHEKSPIKSIQDDSFPVMKHDIALALAVGSHSQILD